MKYQISQNVYVKNSESSKKIKDAEIIEGIEIYYMDDGSCVSLNQIIWSEDEKLKSEELIISIKNRFLEDSSSFNSLVDEMTKEMIKAWRCDVRYIDKEITHPKQD